MQISTLPVYSKLADVSQVPPAVAEKVPQGWHLSQHQLETYHALIQGDADVIFNTAMTGDGKSLAGQLAMLTHTGDISASITMYPTNELIRDQQVQLRGAIQKWNAVLQFESLNSVALDQIMAQGFYTQRGDALLDVLLNNEVVLTNPDVFHYVMHQFYVRPKDATDRIVGPMMQRFQQFTFDEFHIFGTPQVVSVLNALLFIHTMSGPARPHKFLFLSATPEPDSLMLQYLGRSGLKVQQIEGVYQHSATPPKAAQWRRILHGTQVHVESASVEEWVEAHLEDTLLPFFLERRPHAKGAIIVNSVAAAHRLLNRIAPVFQAQGLTVEPNTGLTSRARRQASYAADVLIGTSTVDVGVDFQINFLLFESRDGGSFLQRLGRLGRHDGYERDGKRHKFEDFVAYALVPPWIQETLFVGQDSAPALLEEGATMDRETFNRAIGQAFIPAATFDDYARFWGKLQTVRIMMGLSDRTVRDEYARQRAELGERYEHTFDIQLRPAFGRYMHLKKQPKLLDEATSFRGGSYFTCGVIDESEGGALKTADLFQLVANAELGLLDEQDFYAAVARTGMEPKTFKSRHKPLAFFKMYGWRMERQSYRLVLNRDIGDWGAERFGKASVITGWQLDAAVPGLTRLNRHLRDRKLPALLCLGQHPLALKRRLRLPMLFALYAFYSRDGVEGCVAFGREALLLEVQLRCTGLSTGGALIIT
jgi:CRISPR-associated endonuclease/helicase Cas3